MTHTAFQYREGAVLAAWNARDLYKSALASKEVDALGCSAALFVLSAEESAKSLALYNQSKGGYETNIDPKIFLSHKRKHQEVLDRMILAIGLMSLCNPRKASCNGAEHTCKMDDTCPIVSVLTDWSNTANNLKQSGFYVDYKTGSWHAPSVVTHKDWDVAQSVAESVLVLCEALALSEPLPLSRKQRTKNRFKPASMK